jgi:hypothetical protein
MRQVDDVSGSRHTVRLNGQPLVPMVTGTLFIVVTVFCCWLGYQLNWIRERHAIMDDVPNWSVLEGGITGLAQPSDPGLLWIFGEQG